MSWGIDPELQEMFYGELDERATRLSEGAAELQAGPVPSDRAGAMMREAHTIKGTGRVLGFEAVAYVGEALEELWRRVQSGDIQVNGVAGAALAGVTATLSPAGRGDPVSGTAELIEAFNAFLEVVPIQAAPLAAAPPVDAGGAVAGQEALATNVDSHVASVAVGGGDVGASARQVEAEIGLQPQPELESSLGEAAEVEPEEPEPGFGTGPDDDAVDPPEIEPAVEAHDDEIAEQPADESTVAVDMAPEPELEPEIAPGPDVEMAPGAQVASPSVEGDDDRLEADTGGDGMRHYRVDLAGLMGAVEHWARTEAVPVNAGRLYEMINDVAALRHEAHVAAGRTNAEGADLSAAIAQLQAKADALQTDSLGLAAVPLTGLTSQLPQLVSYLSRKLDRAVALDIRGDEDIAVDKQVLDAIGDPLRQIVVNAIHHGIESGDDRSNAGKPEDGTITVEFSLERGVLAIAVTDDGAGVNWDIVRGVAAADGRLEPEALADPERLRELLFAPGFTTGSDSEFGGGGKGLSTVETIVESLFGRVVLETEPGAGTKVKISVPAFRALQNILLVVAGGLQWGIPAAAVDEVVPLAEVNVERDGANRWISRNGERVPVSAFSEVVGLEEDGSDDAFVVFLNHRRGTAAFSVASVGATRELAVKEMDRIVAGPRHILGAAFLGGDLLLVVDPGRMVERTQRTPGERRSSARVMVVDDSRGARAVVSGALASSGFMTSVAGSAAEALDLLDEVSVDALVVDFSMPRTDGVALVEEVRRRGNLIPIVMLSGVADQEDQERARKAGADAFFEKADFREGTLANALWKMLDD